MRVAVLMGGDTAERDISLKTGEAVAGALRSGGHHVETLVLGDPLEAIRSRAFREADVVFPALHGGAGEDGRIQSLLELAGKPYAGAGPGGCALSMDKVWTKLLCASVGVPTADWREVPPAAPDAQSLELMRPLGWPVVLKPVCEGSAIGVHILQNEAQAVGALREEAVRRGRWMIERYVPGREITLPVLWEEPMAVIEVRPREGFYDYRNKYTAGRTEYDCPAALTSEEAEAVTRHGMVLARTMGLLEMCRIDFRLDPAGQPFVLEANSIPGMTATSLLPMGAAAKGHDFPSLCERLCRRAMDRARRGERA